MRTQLLLRSLALLLVSFCGQFSHAQQLWKPTAGMTLSRSVPTAIPTEGKYHLAELDHQVLRQRLQNARIHPGEAGRSVPQIDLEIPMPDGTRLPVKAEESSLISPAMQQLVPDVRTYIVRDRNGARSLGRISITSAGITGVIFTGAGTSYISPFSNDVHLTYYTRDLQVPAALSCALQFDGVLTEQGRGMAGKFNAGDCQLRTYRLAVAATGEYYQWAGSSYANALTYIIICVNTVNAIYERDMAIRFNLVTTSDIVYTDPATDPYGTALNGTLLTANDNAIDAELGAGNYDVGIVFNNGWSGGLAELYSVCTATRGRSGAGITFGVGANPTAGPQGPVFDNTVAHEIAHQFGATHTMAANNGGCLGNNTAASAWEPGGGSTIMAYAGTCSGNAYQFYSDLYFHSGNISQMAAYATGGFGNSCASLSSLSNAAPDLSVAGTSYTIPVSTPFLLTAIGTDSNPDALSYSWEQMDANAITGSTPSATATTGPNFRAFPPGEQPTRYFPNLPDLLSGTATPYEVLPSVSRALNFRIVVRDNASGGGCNVMEDVQVNTDASGGPFTVTSQNAPVSLTANGSNTFTITWDVAGTAAAPFNCNQVQILFSADGGAHFNYILLAATANDGTESIVVPNIATSAGRIMVRAVGNIFFNVNQANISIASSCPAEGANLMPDNTVTAMPGSAALNLGIAPGFGNLVFPTSGASLSTSDPATTLSVYSSQTSGCVSFSNQFRYDTYPFQVNVSGTYTIAKTAGSYIMNLYNGKFLPGSPCTNMIASNGTFDGSAVGISSSITVALTAGIQYELAVGTFSASTPALPFNYTISVSAAPSGGAAYSGFPNPGAGFSYAYVVVDNNTGNIIEILSSPDLRNSSLYPGGAYTIYGLSYETTSFPPSVLDGFETGPLSALTSALWQDPVNSCGNLSKNSVAVNVFGVLPVELLPLTAVPEGNTVRLRWATAAEMNSQSFELERSFDGRQFETFGQIDAMGNTSSRTDYTLIDQAPMTGPNYYRVRAISADGLAQYSNVALVRFNVTGFNASVFPNPVENTAQLQVVQPAPGVVRMYVYNSLGVQVLTRQINLSAGAQVIPIDMSRHAAGTYIIRVENSSESRVLKMVKK